jgi:hypothetical protein
VSFVPYRAATFVVKKVRLTVSVEAAAVRQSSAKAKADATVITQ